MFFSIFWTACISVCMIILALAGEQQMHSFRRLGVHAWIASSNRRRIGRTAGHASVWTTANDARAKRESVITRKRIWLGDL